MNASHSLPGPQDITRTVLPNGITVLVRSNFNSPSFTLSGFLEPAACSTPMKSSAWQISPPAA